MKERYSPTDSRIPTLLKTIAEVGFGIPVSSQILDDLEIISAAAGTADDEIDLCSDPQIRSAIIANALAFLRFQHDDLLSTNENYIFRMQELRRIMAHFSEIQRESIVSDIEDFCVVTERIRSQTDPQKASQLARIEGQITARVYLDAFPETTRRYPSFHQFEWIIKRAARAGDNMDTFYDLPDDYMHERTLVAPSFKNRLYYLRNVFLDGSKILGIIMRPQVFSKMIGFELREFARRK